MSEKKTIEVMLSGRKIDGKWEAALISKGRFVRALVGDDLLKILTSQVTGLLSSDRPDETSIHINISITEGDPLEEIL